MTIKEKNNKFYCRFKIQGVEKYLLCHGARNVREAQAIEDAEKFKLRQQLAGLIKFEKKVTLHQLLQKFLKYSEINKKSYDTDKCRVQIITELTKDNPLISKIKPEYIENLKIKLIDRDLTGTTVNKYLALLSKAFSIAVDNGWVEVNPVSKVKYFKKKHKIIRYLTEEEQKRLFKVLPSYLKDIVDFALYTGLRKENILELQWYQINFDLNIIEILNNKGNKHIILPLTKPCRELLESLKSKQTSEYVFVNPETNKRWYSIDRAWQKARDAAGLHDFRFHDLRHTVGTRLAKKGVPINVIQEILAHSDIRTTMQYVHCTEGSKLEALNSIL